MAAAPPDAGSTSAAGGSCDPLLDRLPGLPSLVKVSTAELLTVMAIMSVGLPLLLGPVAAWFDLRRTEMVAACGWTFAGLASAFVFAALSRWRIETQLGKRVVRLHSTSRWVGMGVVALLSWSAALFADACLDFRRPSTVQLPTIRFLIPGMCVAMTLLYWKWRNAVRTAEFGERGYSLHILSFVPWEDGPVRWTAVGKSMVMFHFGSRGSRALHVTPEQLAVVERLIARHQGVSD